MSKLVNFVVNVLNDNNKYNNASVYGIDVFDGGVIEEVVFNRNNRELYNKVLEFCIENNFTVISTNPATLSAIIRVEEA